MRDEEGLRGERGKGGADGLRQAGGWRAGHRGGAEGRTQATGGRRTARVGSRCADCGEGQRGEEQRVSAGCVWRVDLFFLVSWV